MTNRLDAQKEFLKMRLKEELSNLNSKTQILNQIYRDSEDVDSELLSEIHTKIGAICYLKGSIDNLDSTLILQEAK